MKTVATIEARMTSTRLPGKVMRKVAEKPLLQWMIERLRHVSNLDDIVVATTMNEQDDPIVDLCEKLGCLYYRGSEENVLQRVLQAAESVNADVICELTADCPVIDPQIVQEAVNFYHGNDFDYVSNCHRRQAGDINFHTYPIGMDVEVFSARALKIAHQETLDPSDLEHVSLYILRHHQFSVGTIEASGKLRRSDLSFTVDEESDFQLIQAIVNELGRDGRIFSLSEMLKFIDSHPEVAKLNKSVSRHKVPIEEIQL